MRSMTQKNWDTRRTDGGRQASSRNRTPALAFLLCFIVVYSLTQAFVLLHVGHRHDLSCACATCAQLNTAETVLKQLTAAAAVAVICLVCLSVYDKLVRQIFTYLIHPTPVALNIRMNN